ncbi:hypothetical protein CGCA056_v015156 [Colletotrichum aenigma]|uniref:uncharacterized protein n=1 Tax=Colletotrichum aenigma TaxID=1215731 RepID=UPI0018721957|nr:uncharacterized protein CGCA056_v015156 [Colletotrichum aenigma]KAF5483090.1 hypothetical protein CGCA056_v015156 [Colletotrichum aenigma]
MADKGITVPRKPGKKVDIRLPRPFPTFTHKTNQRRSPRSLAAHPQCGSAPREASIPTGSLMLRRTIYQASSQQILDQQWSREAEEHAGRKKTEGGGMLGRTRSYHQQPK